MSKYQDELKSRFEKSKRELEFWGKLIPHKQSEIPEFKWSKTEKLAICAGFGILAIVAVGFSIAVFML